MDGPGDRANARGGQWLAPRKKYHQPSLYLPIVAVNALNVDTWKRSGARMWRPNDAALHGIKGYSLAPLFFRIVADSRLISAARRYKKL